MSGDIGLSILADGSIDLEVLANDLKTDDGLLTAVIVSLFTDRQVDQEDVPAGESSRRGWWADLFPEVPGDFMGSRLWLLEREKRTVETLNRAEEYAEEALQWLIEDEVAESIEATASYDENKNLALQIMITKGNETLNFRFTQKWQTESERN